MDDRPTISILIPTFNEIAHIDACLASALAQTAPILEVLVVDGGSTDGTRERVASYGPPVRLVDNPGRGPASAMNVGISASEGSIICRMDAHTVFDPSYVSESLRVLLEEDADVVGGPMHPVGTSAFGRAVAAVTSSALGMPGRFHYARTRIDTDHVYLGMWKRSTLLELGGFDARHFPWCGEDYELSYRIRSAGGRVICDPAVRSDYTPRGTPRALWRQYDRYGLAKASSLETHRAFPSWRPVAPAVLVAVAIIGLLTGRTWRRRSAVPAIHALGCGVIGVWVSRRESSDPLRATLVQEICHWSYGLGLWRGILRMVRSRPVQTPLAAFRDNGEGDVGSARGSGLAQPVRLARIAEAN
jgi:succinoglycan biosynthesis protein ExoA